MTLSLPSPILVFIAGLYGANAPWYIFILPIIILGTVGSRFHPFAIFIGMTTSFTIMGMLASGLGVAFSFLADLLRQFFTLLIIGMGAVLLDDDISNSIMIFWRKHVIHAGSTNSITSRERLLSGLFLGMSLGVLSIPSVGPILGGLLAYIAYEGNLLIGGILLFIYSLALGIPMLIVMLIVAYLSGQVRWFVKREHFFKKISGLIFILFGLMMLFGIDKYFAFLSARYTRVIGL